jgi:arylsulfatase A-like enzyme
MLYRSGFFFAGYTETERFLAPALHDRGIATIGWQEHPYLKHAKGLSSGYGTWSPVPVRQTGPGGDARSTSRDVAEKGIELLGKPENTGRQFFAWTHAMDPHEDYVRHPECPDFGETERDRYDSEVCFTDKWLGHLLDWARKQPWWENTVVIVTSDHGEMFGEHGMSHHAFELWEPLVRVPLLIRVPGVSPKRIEQRRSQIDLAPTILALVGQPAGSGFSGRSLVPEILGTAAPESREPIVLDLPEDTHEQSRRAIIEGSYKLIALGTGRFTLYDISTDPNELNDLAARDPQVLARMKHRLEEVGVQIPFVEPYGGMKLASGRFASGPMLPAH